MNMTYKFIGLVIPALLFAGFGQGQPAGEEVTVVEEQQTSEQKVMAYGRFVPEREDKGKYLIDAVRNRRAEGVIFAAPSFCDPALLDRPMLSGTLSRENIPHISFKYAENSGQMQPIREQA